MASLNSAFLTFYIALSMLPRLVYVDLTLFLDNELLEIRVLLKLFIVSVYIINPGS